MMRVLSCRSIPRSGYNRVLKLFAANFATNGTKLSYTNYKSDTFARRHIGPRDHEKIEMLNTLGYKSMEEFIAATIPASIRTLNQLRLSEPLTESELVKKLQDIGSHNQHHWRSFIGMGYYNCHTPTVIMRNVLENPGWYTPYTPYQAEIAQGRLESLLNYQTLVCDLTGMDIANASLLDEGTAAAEAMQMCIRHHRNKRKTFLVSAEVHPQTLEIIRTRASTLGIQVEVFSETKPWKELNFKEACGVFVQYPDTNGEVKDLSALVNLCQDSGAILVSATDLLATTLIKSPGDYGNGSDIVIGTAQRLGIPLNYGGPHAAFSGLPEIPDPLDSRPGGGRGQRCPR
ncbi:Glycine dehydrogenase (decarboxylating), mitochondrial [Halotydeus destructor]|nr:Glycine dehydrogenase (decarboxylating), mitochondrial [Halotydeus destructor]